MVGSLLPLLAQSLLLIHLNKFDIVQPAPEGGDVGGDGLHIHTLGGEYDGVLALIGGQLDGPVQDGLKSLLVDSLAEVLIVALASIHNQLIEFFVLNVVVVGL